MQMVLFCTVYSPSACACGLSREGWTNPQFLVFTSCCSHIFKHIFIRLFKKKNLEKETEITRLLTSRLPVIFSIIQWQKWGRCKVLLIIPTYGWKAHERPPLLWR